MFRSAGNQCPGSEVRTLCAAWTKTRSAVDLLHRGEKRVSVTLHCKYILPAASSQHRLHMHINI